MDWFNLEEKIIQWLQEDMNNGDITTDSLISEDSVSTAELVAKESGLVAGLEIIKKVFYTLDQEIIVDCAVKDGDTLSKGDVIAKITGKTKNILKGERLALNLLQRLSGIATETAKYAKALQGFPARVTDTRKTTPGLRLLEKYAVRVGGGCNHRFNLSEAVLIKDNHIKASGGIKEAIAAARGNIPHTMKIEIEVETIEQLHEALTCKADIIMLDNMNTETMAQAVAINNGRAVLEASGNISLQNIKEAASTGVDIISVGALTHSAKALDISLKFK